MWDVVQQTTSTLWRPADGAPRRRTFRCHGGGAHQRAGQAGATDRQFVALRPKIPGVTSGAPGVRMPVLFPSGRAGAVRGRRCTAPDFYVQTRQPGQQQPGDRVELLRFSRPRELCHLEDGVWRKAGFPAPVWHRAGKSRRSAGWFAGRASSCQLKKDGCSIVPAKTTNQVLLLEADNHIFSACSNHIAAPKFGGIIGERQPPAPEGVLPDPEVGDLCARGGSRGGQNHFRVCCAARRTYRCCNCPRGGRPARLLWAVGILVAAVLASLAYGPRNSGERWPNKRPSSASNLRVEARLEGAVRGTLYANANDMIYMHDLSGRFTSLNLAGERLLGRKRDFRRPTFLLQFVVEEQRLPKRNQWLRSNRGRHGSQTTMEWDLLSMPPAGWGPARNQHAAD